MTAPTKTPKAEPHAKAVAVEREAVIFADVERQWVDAKWQLIRDAQHKADQAVAKWRRLSDEINSYLDRSGVQDVVQRAKIRNENLALTDAFGASTWFRKEAEVHIADLDMFLKLKKMGVY